MQDWNSIFCCLHCVASWTIQHNATTQHTTTQSLHHTVWARTFPSLHVYKCKISCTKMQINTVRVKQHRTVVTPIKTTYVYKADIFIQQHFGASNFQISITIIILLKMGKDWVNPTFNVHMKRMTFCSNNKKCDTLASTQALPGAVCNQSTIPVHAQHM